MCICFIPKRAVIDTFSKYNIKLRLVNDLLQTYKNNIMDKTKQPKDIVYLDTNVISFYFDLRPEIKLMKEATRKWWAQKSDNYYICTSVAVERELQDGNYYHQPECIELVKKIAVLPGDNKEIDQIARYYIEHLLAPKENIEEF